MNIVLLPTPPFEEIGGVSTHVYMLAKGLRILGHSVFVIQENPSQWFRLPFVRFPELVISRINLYFSRRYRRWAEEVYYIFAVIWKTRGKIDVINIQNVQHIGMAKLVQQLLGCKIALTVHGYLTYEAESGKWCSVGDKTHQWLYSMEKEGYDKSDAIVCVGRAVESYVKQFTTKSIELIHNGLDMDFFQPDSNIENKCNCRRILFAGILQESKGIMDVLQVILVLAQEFGQDVTLSIAGKGPQELSARQFVIEHGLEANVKFLGSLGKDAMPKFYSGGDLFVCPSSQRGLSGKGEEPFGYTALEAMSCGVPVVAYKTGGLQEQVQDGITGYLVEAGNVAELTTRVRTLIADAELLKKMGIAARNHCVQNFSHIKMAQQYVDVYKCDSKMTMSKRQSN